MDLTCAFSDTRVPKQGGPRSQMTGTSGLQRVPRSAVENYKIPLPPLATQQALVAEIEAEQSLVAANRELVERMEGKIRAAIGRVWGEADR